MQLEDFFDYKNQLIGDLLTSQTILKLLDDDLRETDRPESMVYKQVFPYAYVPDTIEHGATYICCDVDIQKSVSKTFLLPTITVWVFSHKSKLRLPEGGVRTDKLVSEIAKVMNGSRCYGLGELELYSTKRFAPITDYQGKIMTFHTKEFNRPSPNPHAIPHNRKGRL